MAFDKGKALQEAHKYITQGKIAKAIRQYELALENEPGDLTLLNVIGDLYARENDISEALKCFYRLADAYTREGYKLKAISIYKKIVRLDRESVDPLLRLAELSSAQGLARETRECFKSALDFFERKGQHVQSLEVLRNLCRLDPRNHSLRLHLGRAAERAGEGREAVEAYLGASILARDNGDIAASRVGLERAAELAPESAEVHLLRARQALADEKPKEVGEILGSVPELQSSPEAKRLLLESCLATSNLEAASGLLSDVLESNPSNFTPAADFTSRCIEKGDYEAAFRVLKRAAPMLIARGETGPLMEALARLSRSCPEHIHLLERIYEVAEKTDDGEAVSEVLQALANAYAGSDQLEKAEHAYASLVEREPGNELFKDLLQKICERRGRGVARLSQTPETSVDSDGERDKVASHFGCGEAPPQAQQLAPRASFLPPSQEEAGAPSFEDPHWPAQPVEFDLSQAGRLGETRAKESELPPPKEFSLDFHTRPSDAFSTGDSGLPRADSSSEMALHHDPAKKSETFGPPPPSTLKESREEAELQLRHGLYQEPKKSAGEPEKISPAEGQILEFRRGMEQAARESNATNMPMPASRTGEQAADKAEWNLPTCFADAASVADPVRGNQPPASANSQAGRKSDPAASDGAAAELRSLLDEFDGESESADKPADDEQTHYNLGVAFREMGLLDEAIGEFQKVVNGMVSTRFGPHFLQGCTLLASCFMDKEMPAIAAKWYLRALDAPGLDYEGTLAVYYDLGMAFQQAGDTTAALEKFTEVYSQNINYRDVAEKIRILRQTSR